MKSSFVTYFSLKSKGTFQAPFNLQYQAEHDELFISPHLRLCGLDKMVCIYSRDLAETFKEAILPRLQQRYGDTFDLQVVEWESSDKKMTQRIDNDSSSINKRLETQNFAGNVSP